MIKKILIILIALFLTKHFIYAQKTSDFCGVTGAIASASYGAGGYRLPSTGTIDMLLVFAEFPDDQYDTTNTRWVKGQQPQNMNNWIDNSWSSNPTQGSLTHYFNEMSDEKLKITGKEIHIVAPHTRHEYFNLYSSNKRGNIHRELLQQIDLTEDFARYDNWEYVKNYTHNERNDTFVDMVIIIWRNVFNDTLGYKSDLGFLYSYGDLGYGADIPVDGGLRFIDPNTLRSGATVNGYLGTDPFKVTIHEFAHYLLGYNSMHNGFGFWGMLSDWGTKSYVANSFERAQLQWMDNTDFCTLDASAGSAPDTTLNLTDYITNNQAIKVIVDTTDDKYFYIENHQNLSYWETHAPFSDHPNSTDGLVENGIYVIRQHSFSNGSNIMEMSKSLIPADGRYSWNAIDAIPNPYGGTKILPVWEKLGEDKYNGYHTLEFVPHTNTTPGVQNPSSIYFGFKSTFPFWEDISEHQGDGEDAFRIGYNDTFGPRTNPNTQMKDRVIVDFTVKLNSDSSGIYSLSVYFNYWEGELESDVNFTGNITVGGDLTVPSGRTLTVAAGSQLTFTNNSSLIVDGTLNVNGTSTEKVIFDFVAQNSTTQNGIKINNGASVNIDHAIIKNAYRGIYVNEDLTLTNSEIKDCQTGLYQYNSGYTYIRNNKFHNNDDVGAYLYNSNGTFIENEFSYNDIGIECIYNSSPNLINGYNEFNTNFIGVFVDHSHPMLGIVEGCIDDGGYNSFDFSVDHHMEIYNNSTVYAQKNWWNSYASIYIESGSQCFRVPDLTAKPVPLGTIKITPEEEMFNKKFSTQLSSANRLEKNLTTTVANDFKYNVNWSLDWKLLYARKLIEIKKYNFAIKVCEDIIEQYPDSSLSYLALHLLHKASVKGKEKDKFKKFVDNKSKLKVKKQLYGYAELLLTMEEKENRILELNNLKEKYKDTDLVESVLFDKFMYFLNEENNLELAKLVSEELGKLFPNSRLYISSQRQLGVDVETPKMSELKKGNSEEEVADIPKTYELLGNYPNPFNPSTTISYALPYSSNVELTIYDITGKVVKVFSENGQSAGYQNIVWFGNNQQGSRVSSGVYFYRFKAVSLEGNGKVFEKTTKMLLLK